MRCWTKKSCIKMLVVCATCSVRRVFDRHEVIRLRDVEHLSWREIARRTGVGVGTVGTPALTRCRSDPKAFGRSGAVCDPGEWDSKAIPARAGAFEKWKVFEAPIRAVCRRNPSSIRHVALRTGGVIER